MVELLFSDTELPFFKVNSKDPALVKEYLKERIGLFNRKEYRYSSIHSVRTHGYTLQEYIAGIGFTPITKDTGQIEKLYSFITAINYYIARTIFTPSIDIIQDIDTILEVERDKDKIFAGIKILYKKLKDKPVKIVLTGEFNNLPDDISKMFIDLDITDELLEFKTKYINTLCKVHNIKQADKLKSFSYIELNNIDNLMDAGLKFEEAVRLNRSTSIIEPIESNTEFKDIGGLDDIKNYFNNLKNLLKRAIKNWEIPTKFLFCGKSGCGKTLMAKAVARELNLPLYRADLGRIFNKYLGNSERNIRLLWKEIESVSPAVILFDEVEKMMAGVDSSNVSDAGTTARILSYMLYQLQESKLGSIIVGTVNNIEALPEEFFRDDRWNKTFVIMPNFEYAFKVLKLYIEKYSNDRLSMKESDELLKFFTENIKAKEVLSKLCGASIKAKLDDIVMDILANSRKLKVNKAELLEKVKEVFNVNT